jgi:PhnB protein
MRAANPYLNFPGNTEEAFTFYASVFRTEIAGLTRYRHFGDNRMGVADEHLDLVANVGLPLGPNSLLMGTDVVAFGEHTRPFTAGNNFYITIETDDVDEAERIHGELAEGGAVDMPLERTEWAERYGIVVDRFGIQWMVMYTGEVEFRHPES